MLFDVPVWGPWSGIGSVPLLLAAPLAIGSIALPLAALTVVYSSSRKMLRSARHCQCYRMVVEVFCGGILSSEADIVNIACDLPVQLGPSYVCRAVAV